MTKKMLLTLLIVPLTMALYMPALADEAPACIQVDEKVRGDLEKYSVYGDANGPLYFSGISCAIRHRNKTLCAMEMVSFDSTAMVYDFQTGEEVAAAKAYYWIGEKNGGEQVLAFGGKDSADKYLAGQKHGTVVDYQGLKGRFSE